MSLGESRRRGRDSSVGAEWDSGCPDGAETGGRVGLDAACRDSVEDFPGELSAVDGNNPLTAEARTHSPSGPFLTKSAGRNFLLLANLRIASALNGPDSWSSILQYHCDISSAPHLAERQPA